MTTIEEAGTQVSETYRARQAWSEALHDKIWKSVDGTISYLYTIGAVELKHNADGSWS